MAVSWLKIDKCLEWLTPVPFTFWFRPQESETFLIQNAECSLHLSRDFDFNYKIYLKPKDETATLKPFPITIYMLYYNGSPECFDKSDADFQDKDTHIYSFGHRSCFGNTAKLWNYVFPVSVRFLFLFRNYAVEPLLPTGKKLGNKSVQTPSYNDASFSGDGFSHDFSKLLEEDSSRDVQFRVGDAVFKAHKHILCCRSEVLAAVLQGKLKEEKMVEIDIKDMDPTNFRHFLHFLYTGLAPVLSVDSAIQLYQASHKYNIKDLNKLCAEFLADHLTSSNSCDILLLSDLHNDVNLKESAINYIIKHCVPFQKAKWATFLRQNPTLAAEVYERFCDHIRPK